MAGIRTCNACEMWGYPHEHGRLGKLLVRVSLGQRQKPLMHPLPEPFHPLLEAMPPDVPVLVCTTLWPALCCTCGVYEILWETS